MEPDLENSTQQLEKKPINKNIVLKKLRRLVQYGMAITLLTACVNNEINSAGGLQTIDSNQQTTTEATPDQNKQILQTPEIQQMTIEEHDEMLATMPQKLRNSSFGFYMYDKDPNLGSILASSAVVDYTYDGYLVVLTSAKNVQEENGRFQEQMNLQLTRKEDGQYIVKDSFPSQIEESDSGYAIVVFKPLLHPEDPSLEGDTSKFFGLSDIGNGLVPGQQYHAISFSTDNVVGDSGFPAASPQTFTINPEGTRFTTNGITGGQGNEGAPVVDGEGNIVGILTYNIDTNETEVIPINPDVITYLYSKALSGARNNNENATDSMHG